jgi:hypothetical protein
VDWNRFDADEGHDWKAPFGVVRDTSADRTSVRCGDSIPNKCSMSSVVGGNVVDLRVT